MKAIDLFSGCGGLSLGLLNAGISVESAFENWEPAIKIYRQNFNHPVVDIDLNDVDLATDQISKCKVDMIAGGPPCQDFSSAGKRNEKGGRADLTISYAKIVESIKPKWFLMENVERASQSKAFKKAKSILYDAGYGMSQMVIDASLVGVPQKRKRLFLIGRMKEENDFLNDQLLSGLSKKATTVRQYFSGSIDTEFYYRHPRSYERRGIFSIDEPSPTIRGVNRPIPPDYKFHVGDASKNLQMVRPLTTKERALIQTFPKDFDWAEVPKSVLEQIIGNAVPVSLGEYVGRAIMRYETLSRQNKKKQNLLLARS